VDEPLCARGADCQDRQPGVDPDTGTVTHVGAPVEQDSGLCATCIRYVRYALAALPLDVAELTTLLRPSMAVRHRDPQLPDQPRVKLDAPVPIDLRMEARRALIDHETLLWAEAVVVASGETWDDEWARSTRIGHRVQHTASLLADNVLLLLSLPTERRPVYSTGIERHDGHNVDEVTTDGRDVYADRDGLDGALTCLSLHRQVEAVAGRISSTRLRLPCPICRRMDLHREHHRSRTDPRTGEVSQGRVVCRTCWRPMTDWAYEEYRATTARAFGVPL